MRINEALNIVVPIYDGGSVAGYVHSIPLSRAAFETHYRLVASTFAAIFEEGLGEIAGPRVAALVLADVAKGKGLSADPLLNEIKRLTCYIVPGGNGWEQIPFVEAERLKQISEDDLAEVMSALVFFTVASAMWPRKRAADLIPGVARLWGAETSSLQPMAWINSLQTSTATASSGATVPLNTAVTTAADGTTATSSLPS